MTCLFLNVSKRWTSLLYVILVPAETLAQEEQEEWEKVEQE